MQAKALVTVEKTAVQTVGDKRLRVVRLALEPEDAWNTGAFGIAEPDPDRAREISRRKPGQ